MKVAVFSTRPYDRTHLDALPSAERAWARAATGVGQSIIDNSQAIMVGLAANDAAFPEEQKRFGGGSGGVGGGGGGGAPGLPGTGGAAGGRSGAGGSGGSGAAGTGASGGTPNAGPPATPGASGGNQSGCGCGVTQGGAATRAPLSLSAVTAMWLVGLSRRRRRRRHSDRDGGGAPGPGGASSS